MAKITMEDDCLVPEGQLIIKFSGPNPFRAVQGTAKFLRKVWEVEAKDYWERDFRYNPDEDPRGFFLTSYIKKTLDGFTSVIIETIIQGKQPSDPNKEGWCEIKIGGVLKTSFGGSTIFQDTKNPIVRSFYWFYDKYFHRMQRMKYLDYWCRHKLGELKRLYQEALEITPTGEARVL
ncbi:MAG: hypothetical protein COZ04_03835 [Candidatus Aenigmarchaeota archaeon CG_4_10_14_3_um_filter_37_21]|nr:hypothetical protein [Candidatus Aenigmarchaeota archaeon]PIY35355.1 MAG: hypothetical protein COZ04_03835 [Candidatus Aenigmarchaeota archaeon CG_4_10_14_3_um_filter_37_21]